MISTFAHAVWTAFSDMVSYQSMVASINLCRISIGIKKRSVIDIARVRYKKLLKQSISLVFS
mgnify:CR=1 FL=1